MSETEVATATSVGETRVGASVRSGSLRGSSFPSLLLDNASRFGDRPAMREKDLGIWQTFTWREVLEEVESFSIGLSKLGVGEGDKVVIIGDNRPRLYWTMCATQALGAIPVPTYQDSSAEELAYVIEHSGATAAAAENQEQVDKALEARESNPSLRLILYDDSEGLDGYRSEGLSSFDEARRLGREAGDEASRRWREEISKRRGDEIAVVLYTSGTTGKPKGVALTNDNLLISARNANAFDRLTEVEETVAYLPMAWVGDHAFSYAQALDAGYCVNCPENRETVADDRREIGPTYFFAPPRIYEMLLTQIMVRMADASGLKRGMFDYFMRHARRCGERLLDGKPVALAERFLYALGEILVYGPLRNRLGFSRVRVAYTAGEAIGPEIFRFYRSLGVNLKQLYGQTEASVYVTLQPDGDIDADTVGVPAPEVEVALDTSNGEVLYRSPGVFREYFRDPEATAAAKTSEGWVRSGDAGVFDRNGRLKIIDRAKDVGRLNDGTLFPPKYIENKLKFYPNVKEAVAFGDGRDYVSALINIDLTAVGSWAERRNVAYASYQELAGHDRVYEMIREHVEEVNRALADESELCGAQIRRFLILHKELDADDGEITRTNKVRRSLVAERYAPLIEALYDPSVERREIETEVTFEDGRKGMLRGDVRIVNLESASPTRQAA